ncbi:alpha/beta hydrolase [Nocardia sp. BMG51109]|uniref:alpha/beta hydrolase n=1 Tax=Nocardia sp. BMG51109 TaxID=1056816 RepID=UPI0004662DB8|nr:alpha/beta fold hydrolase [Nocardia sp. BMG51109]
MRASVRAISAALATVAFACFVPAAAQADPPSDRDCRSFPFAVPQGQLAATLCLPPGQPTDTVMVLMSGSNYNGQYWDFPYEPETYNFRQAMNEAGYATLVVDRLGNGASSKPPALSLTANTTAEALHQIVRSARRGIAGAQPFGKVITVGHSLTSGTSVMEAAAHRDVDGVLLTGYSHAPSYGEILGVISSYYPAVNDPRFAGRGYDPNYLTTRPGSRMHDFFDPADADPAVVDLDEKTKEVFSLSEYPDGMLSMLPGMSSFIDAPVMIATGSKDRLSCGIGYAVCASSETLHAAEAPYFAPEARLRTFVLPGSGHSVNLARNTVDYQAAVVDWANSITGR